MFFWPAERERERERERRQCSGFIDDIVFDTERISQEFNNDLQHMLPLSTFNLSWTIRSDDER